MNVAAPIRTSSVTPKPLGFVGTVPVIDVGDAVTTPWVGALRVSDPLPLTTASQGQPGASVKLNEIAPPWPGKLWDGGEMLGLHNVGELKSILVMTFVCVPNWEETLGLVN